MPNVANVLNVVNKFEDTKGVIRGRISKKYNKSWKYLNGLSRHDDHHGTRMTDKTNVVMIDQLSSVDMNINSTGWPWRV
jgi:hypothetical protein